MRAVLLCMLLLAIPVQAGAPPAIEASDYEVKILVDPADEDRLLDALDAGKPLRRDVWFVDTAKLDLLGREVVLRARAVEDDLELTVKLRGSSVHFAQFSSFAGRKKFDAGVDVTGGKSAACVTLEDDDHGSFDAKHPIRRFTEEQVTFAESHALLILKNLNLRAFGPIHSKVRQKKLSGLDVTVETWPLPDGTRLVEISAKVKTKADVSGCAKKLDAFLWSHGVRRAAVQGAKTRRALESFL